MGNIYKRLYLCEFSFCEDVIVPLPDPLDGHCGRKKTISNTKNGKDNHKNDY